MEIVLLQHWTLKAALKITYLLSLMVIVIGSLKRLVSMTMCQTAEPCTRVVACKHLLFFCSSYSCTHALSHILRRRVSRYDAILQCALERTKYIKLTFKMSDVLFLLDRVRHCLIVGLYCKGSIKQHNCILFYKKVLDCDCGTLSQLCPTAEPCTRVSRDIHTQILYFSSDIYLVAHSSRGLGFKIFQEIGSYDFPAIFRPFPRLPANSRQK